MRGGDVSVLRGVAVATDDAAALLRNRIVITHRIRVVKMRGAGYGSLVGAARVVVMFASTVGAPAVSRWGARSTTGQRATLFGERVSGFQEVLYLILLLLAARGDGRLRVAAADFRAAKVVLHARKDVVIHAHRRLVGVVCALYALVVAAEHIVTDNGSAEYAAAARRDDFLHHSRVGAATLFASTVTHVIG